MTSPTAIAAASVAVTGEPQRGDLAEVRLEQHVGADHDQHHQHDRVERRPRDVAGHQRARHRADEREHHQRHEGPRVGPDPAVVRRASSPSCRRCRPACWWPGSAPAPRAGSPSSSAGSWTSPPPPTTASTNPAASARQRRAAPARPYVGSSTRGQLCAGARRMTAVRIVSLLPSTTEILFAIGAGRRRRRRDLRVRLPRRGARPRRSSRPARCPRA